ncbi:MAG: 3-alpha-hydroxysteroid dehydrogenase [Acidimicrobiaceae bacterium]|jgi:3alpha(or 20beta)-hydroxysteroid dehydrogenase|nr:3-alpha-hydroxysteroid dehydrogenase [Acidimicrobiaceae bacterium]|tara:strand:- start:196 stop:996 length:801 start_codon:yes stop_codon:yes gene_type:complete
MMRLQDKIAIVTGAARGSGELAARRLVADGAKVVIADLLDDRGKQVASELGDAARYLHLDITDEDRWQQVIDFCIDTYGGLTTLVNNAAVLHVRPIEHTTTSDFVRLLEVNTVGTFLGVRSVIEPLRSCGGGSIINVASISGHHPAAGTSAYAASKFGVRGLTKVAALELGRYGIRVNSINPAMGNPEMVMESLPADMDTSGLGRGDVLSGGQPILRAGDMADVANAVAFLASDDSSFFNGADFDLDGGITAGSHLLGGIPGAPRE